MHLIRSSSTLDLGSINHLSNLQCHSITQEELHYIPNNALYRNGVTQPSGPELMNKKSLTIILNQEDDHFENSSFVSTLDENDLTDQVTPIAPLRERSSTPYSPRSTKIAPSSSPKSKGSRFSSRRSFFQNTENDFHGSFHTLRFENQEKFTQRAQNPHYAPHHRHFPPNLLQMTMEDHCTKALPRIKIEDLKGLCNVDQGPMLSNNYHHLKYYIENGSKVYLHPIHQNLSPEQRPFTIFVAPGYDSLPSVSNHTTGLNPSLLNKNHRFFHPKCALCHSHDRNTPGHFSTCEVLSPSLKWLEISTETIKLIDLVIFYKTVPHANANFWTRLSEAYDHAMTNSGHANFDYYDLYNVITPSYSNNKSSLLSIELLFKAAFFIALELRDPYIMALIGYPRHQPYSERVQNARYWFSQQPSCQRLVQGEEILIWIEQVSNLAQDEFPILVFESMLLHFVNRLNPKSERVIDSLPKGSSKEFQIAGRKILNNPKVVRRHSIIETLTKAYELYDEGVKDYWIAISNIADTGAQKP